MSVRINNNRSSAAEWFRHDAPSGTSSEVSYYSSYSPSSGASGLAKVSAGEVRAQLQSQIAEKRQIKQYVRQQEQAEISASLAHEKALVLEQQKREANAALEKKLRLKMGLDMQVAARIEAKRQEQEEKHNFFVQQQDSLSQWKREQEDDKARKHAQMLAASMAKKVQMMELENQKKIDALRKREEERQQLSQLTAMLEEQENSRKKFFKQIGGNQLISASENASVTGALGSSRSSNGGGTLPFGTSLDAQDDKLGGEERYGKIKDRAALSSALLEQIAEKKRREIAEREADKQYAVALASKAQQLQEEEESRRRQAQEKNMIFRSCLEQQMAEKRLDVIRHRDHHYGHYQPPSQPQSQYYLQVPQEHDSVSQLINTTRPW